MRLPEQSIWDGDIMTTLQKLAPRVGFEQRLALGAAIAVGIVAVIVLVLGTDVGVARLGRRFGRSLRCDRRGGRCLSNRCVRLVLSFICISPCHVLMLNIIDCRTKKGGGPDWIRRPWRFAMRCG